MLAGSMFPERFVTASPDEYSELVVELLANPTGKQLAELSRPLFADQTELLDTLESEQQRLDAEMTDEQRADVARGIQATRERQADRLAAAEALSYSYRRKRYEAYGYAFDFTNAAAAAATLDDPALPDDLRFWLRNAPIEVSNAVTEGIGKKLRQSLHSGKG